MGRCTHCGKTLSPGEMGAPCPNCGGLDRGVSAVDQIALVDVAEAAETLARKHYEIESGLTRIFLITASAEAGTGGGTPIRLLEVNEDTPESGVMPLHFGPAPASGVPYPSVIIEVSPAEFQRLRANELRLPEGWSIGEEFPRPSPAGSR